MLAELKEVLLVLTGGILGVVSMYVGNKMLFNHQKRVKESDRKYELFIDFLKMQHVTLGLLNTKDLGRHLLEDDEETSDMNASIVARAELLLSDEIVNDMKKIVELISLFYPDSAKEMQTIENADKLNKLIEVVLVKMRNDLKI